MYYVAAEDPTLDLKIVAKSGGKKKVSTKKKQNLKRGDELIV